MKSMTAKWKSVCAWEKLNTTINLLMLYGYTTPEVRVTSFLKHVYQVGVVSQLSNDKIIHNSSNTFYGRINNETILSRGEMLHTIISWRHWKQLFYYINLESSRSLFSYENLISMMKNCFRLEIHVFKVKWENKKKIDITEFN